MKIKKIIVLILLFVVCVLALQYTSKEDKKAIDNCTKETGDRAFCTREYFGTE